jgi:hypothetical protein
MATTYVERTIFLVSPDRSIDEFGLESDTGLQGFANLSVGNALIEGILRYKTWGGASWTHHIGYTITGYLTSANDVTVVGGIAAFSARWPQYQVFTWSRTLVFGV